MARVVEWRAMRDPQGKESVRANCFADDNTSSTLGLVGFCRIARGSGRLRGSVRNTV